MVLIEKNLPFELIEIDVYNKPDWFASVSPYGKVPVLSHEGRTIYESAIINEYLDERFPETPLMPTDHFERANARIWIDYCSNHYLPACTQLMRDRNNPEKQKKNHQNIKEKLMFIETECFQKHKDGLFWMGETISLVDLHYAPFFECFGAYEHLFNAQWPEECTQLTAWWSAMQQRESYKSTFLPLESHIKTYSDMMQRIAS